MEDDELEQFIPLWLRNYLSTLGKAERDRFLSQYREAVLQMLEQLEKLPMNQLHDGTERGKFSTRIPGTNSFVNLKEAVWTTAKYGGPLLLASAFAAPLLAVAGITVAAAHITLGTGASAGFALYEAFSRLNEDELDVYKAVAAAIERNKNRVLENEGADFKQVEHSYTLDKDLVPPLDLPAMLEQLEKKKVIESKVIGTVKQYFLSF
jgi:hypothetical protein